MILHAELGNTAFKRSRQLKTLIDSDDIHFAGNRKLKIFGTLNCTSGKRMKVENRVFFVSKKEAISEGYRPCGHCMRDAYFKWKGR
jgi:methylphosphotriester-DNA--protein-cysteine methyltransferase